MPLSVLILIQRFQEKSEFKGIFRRNLLCQTPAPIGNHLVAVNVALYIVPTIDGSITLKVEVPFHAGVSYEKAKA